MAFQVKMNWSNWDGVHNRIVAQFETKEQADSQAKALNTDESAKPYRSTFYTVESVETKSKQEETATDSNP